MACYGDSFTYKTTFGTMEISLSKTFQSFKCYLLYMTGVYIGQVLTNSSHVQVSLKLLMNSCAPIHKFSFWGHALVYAPVCTVVMGSSSCYVMRNCYEF
jgi:hypothetical protein